MYSAVETAEEAACAFVLVDHADAVEDASV